MVYVFWIAVGFLIGTIVWNPKFRTWTKNKVLKKNVTKPVIKDEDENTIVVKEIIRKSAVSERQSKKPVKTDDQGNIEV